MKALIVKSTFKRMALDLAGKRAHKFTRVSQEFVDRAEYAMRVWLMREIEAHPSKGRTLK